MNNQINPVLILTRNNLGFTMNCVDSVREQDIPTTVVIVDNGSDDGTVEWGESQGFIVMSLPTNTGFSNGMNVGLKAVFEELDAEHCLCPNNDVVLAPWYYRMLLDLDYPVVSGVQGSGDHRHTIEDLKLPPPVEPIRPNPDFSAILFHREAWEKIGPFDTAMVNYASDCDLHVRAHRAGVKMIHAHIPFFHEGSSTLRYAPPSERLQINRRADEDREEFRKKWGCMPGSEEYNALFAEELFGVDR